MFAVGDSSSFHSYSIFSSLEQRPCLLMSTDSRGHFEPRLECFGTLRRLFCLIMGLMILFRLSSVRFHHYVSVCREVMPLLFFVPFMIDIGTFCLSFTNCSDIGFRLQCTERKHSGSSCEFAKPS
jgi:hypothetical protein